MTINLELYVQFLFVFVPIATGLTYWIASTKTDAPAIATVIGFFLALVPPLSVLYILFLVFKKPLSEVECAS